MSNAEITQGTIVKINRRRAIVTAVREGSVEFSYMNKAGKVSKTSYWAPLSWVEVLA